MTVLRGLFAFGALFLQLQPTLYPLPSTCVRPVSHDLPAANKRYYNTKRVPITIWSGLVFFYV